jgi:drug/metabolite transporter (DMT)-like permease
MTPTSLKPTAPWKLGLLLASMTCLFWATLPLALKVSLEALDPFTLTWIRFVCAAVFTFLLLAARNQLGGLRGLTSLQWFWLLVAAFGLIGNYVLYLIGLKYTTPANAQLLVQSAPLLLALGSVIWFKERINRYQAFGFAAIVLGLLLFFIEQRTRSSAASTYGFGAMLILLGAITWVVYALIQKTFANRLTSQQVLLVMYVIAAIALLPTATPSALAQVDSTHWWAIGYCAFNTIAAYAAFAEAMALWDASRVSAILSMTPVFTVACVAILAPLFPAHLQPERIALMGFVGGALVVAGSITASLTKSKPAA